MPTPTIGELIRRLREARKLSQHQLATAAGLDHSYIAKLERNENVPSAVTIARLAAALDVSIDDLTNSPAVGPRMARGRLVRRNVLELPVYIARRGGQLHEARGRSMSVEASGAFVVEVAGDDLLAYGLSDGERILIEDREPSVGEVVATKFGAEVWLGIWTGDRAQLADGSLRAGEIIGTVAYRLQPIGPRPIIGGAGAVALA